MRMLYVLILNFIFPGNLFSQIKLQSSELAFSLIASDSVQANRFYVECLGLKYNGSQSITGLKMMLFGCGAATIKVRVYHTAPPARNTEILASNGFRFVSIPVINFETVILRIQQNGFAESQIKTESNVRTAMVKDGDNNVIELIDAITAPSRKLELGLIVSNMDSADFFYINILGLEKALAEPGPKPVENSLEHRYKANNTVIRLFAPPGIRSTYRESIASFRGYRYITFALSADVDLLYQEFLDRGYQFAAPLAPYGQSVYLFMVWGPGGAIHEFIGPKHVDIEPSHTEFTDMVFTTDYYAPGLSANEDIAKALEANALEIHNGKIYCATTYAGPAGDPKTSDPKILVKDSANVKWRIDYQGGNKFVRFPIIRSIVFTSDGAGNPLIPPVSVLIAGTGAWRSWNPDGVYVISRNDSTNQWVETKLSDQCWNIADANHGFEVRMLFDHRDRVTGVHFVFAGAYNGALYRGWYNPSMPGLIEWDPIPEIDNLLGHVLCAATIDDTVYIGMSFGEASGVSFVWRPFKDYGIWKRIDGNRWPVSGHDYNPNDDLQWKWIEIKEWENANKPGEHLRMGQFRGLSVIPDTDNNQNPLLGFHWDSPDGVIETIDPQHGYKLNTELNTKAFVQDIWKNQYAGVITAGYNDWLTAKHPDTREEVQLIGLWANYPGGELGSDEGKSSWFLVRYQDASYNLVRIWDKNNTLPGATNGLKGCRSIRPSPFPEEAGRVWYFAGFDLTGPGTSSIAGNKAWIYKGYIANPTSIEKEDKNIPAGFNLYQNYPNPFNPETVISYQISASSHVTLKVFDVLGREVATLVDEYKQPGIYNLTFKINNSILSSGFYFCQLKAGNFFQTKKMGVTK